MAEEKVWVVTGANRGIGLEFVRQLLLDPANFVFATMRKIPADGDAAVLKLQNDHSKDRLELVELDQTSEATVAAAAAHIEKLKPGGIDYIINNAGFAGDEKVLAIDTTAEDYTAVLDVNVVGPFRVTKALKPLLERKKKRTVVNIGSNAGSCALTLSQVAQTSWVFNHIMAYHTSKAALNMQTAVLANQLHSEGYIIICLHPGFVATDMGNLAAQHMGMEPALTPQESAEKMLTLIQGLKQEDNGHYLQYDGQKLEY